MKRSRLFSLLQRSFVVVVLMGLTFTTWSIMVDRRAPPAPVTDLTHLVLLVPDNLPEGDVGVHAWRDAAAELGFALEVVPASKLLRSAGLARNAALILPDMIHRQMNNALITHLQHRVRDGARVMLVHDAGVADMDDQYHPRQSRLSEMAGVRYALYGQLKTAMLSTQEAWVDVDALTLLRLPPGKLMRQDSDRPLTSAQIPPRSEEKLAVAGYHYGPLHYPAFATKGTFLGQRLMHGAGDNLLAGLHHMGQGQVLFVNLPLTYLKLRTDGFFMHSFLRYFAQDLAHLPQLSEMPKGVGALIMNWHIDSAAALPAIEQLAELGVFEQGPYSVHLTAGPDVDVPGDGGGTNLENNARMREWVSRFVARGDAIGSHGGWIHNEFGRLVSTQPQARSVELIERNSAVVSQASGQPIREYSAPLGNQPAWVTPWLRARNIHAYYFTGDIGMAPTRSYQDGLRSPADMWAFPVLSYGRFAALEEAHTNESPEAEVAAWLNDVADFCAEHKTARLMYFHPPGMMIYPQAFQGWLRHTQALTRTGRLRWMTMTHYADFANRRLQVRWRVQADASTPLRMHLEASHAQSLDQMSWQFPVQRYAQPEIQEGQAQVHRDGIFWRVTASHSPRLVVSLPLLPTQTPDADTLTPPPLELRFEPQCCRRST